MTTVLKQLRSSYGFESPYFIVDSSGNLVTQTITVTGNRIELTKGSYLSYNGQPLLTQTALGSTVTGIPGTLTGLTVGSLAVPATTNLVGALKLSGGMVPSTWNPATLSTIDNTTIGATTPAAGTFTNLTINGSVTINSANISLSPPGLLTLGTTGQTINLQGNLALTGTQSFRVSPTDSSAVLIQPTATGTIDNMTIGSVVPATGTFVTVTQTAPNERWNSTVRNQVATKRYTENLTMAMNFFAMGQ
jgi:hypothetical protein